MKDRNSTPSPSVATGMLVMASSSVLFSAMSILIPLTRSVNTSLVVSARFVTGIAVILGMAALGFVKLKAVNRWWLLVRGVIGATSVYFFYRGIMNLGLGKGTILNYTYPIFAALFAPLLLKERLPWDVLAAVVVSFAGIWMVVNPGSIGAISIEDLFALLGGILSGVAVVAIKKLRETETPYIIYLAQCVFGLLVIGWPTATSSFSFAAAQWLILLAIGIVATVAQLTMTWAYKHVSATEGSLMAFLTPVLNVFLGVIVFGESMGVLTVAGSVIVLLCCGYVAFRERILKLIG
jgi:drug/metabolite transporter (DMT)-like permease